LDFYFGLAVLKDKGEMKGRELSSEHADPRLLERESQVASMLTWLPLAGG
jgi:hypothetical protein